MPGQAQAGVEPLVVWVDGLALLLGRGVDQLLAVHGARADAHQNAVPVSKLLPQIDILEKTVLRRDVPAAQENHIGVGEQITALILGFPEQQGEFGKPDADLSETALHTLRKPAEVGIIVRVRGDEQGAAGFRQSLFQLVHKAVCRVQCREVGQAGVAGEEIDHE